MMTYKIMLFIVLALGPSTFNHAKVLIFLKTAKK